MMSGHLTPTLISRQAGGFKKETFSSSDAYMFPVTGSIALFSLYLIFNYLDKEHVNLLLAVYFAILGFAAVVSLLADLVYGIEVYFDFTQYEIKVARKTHLILDAATKDSLSLSKPSEVDDLNAHTIQGGEEVFSPNQDVVGQSKKSTLNTTRSSGKGEPNEGVEDDDDEKDEKEDKNVLFKLSFTILTLWTTFLGLLITLAYFFTKHWSLNNFFGIAFSVSAIRLMDVDSFKTGMILLSGLFFYDIFWVFGTDVMVSVAKNFEAPVKLMFPKDIFADTLQYTMLGLGDIVIPGIFIALCLRFDYHQYLHRIAHAKSKRSKSSSKRSKSSSVPRSVEPTSSQLYSKSFPKPYFKVCFIFYVIGLITTVVVMHTFKAAQPALLYLSPACILSVTLVGLIRGEINAVMHYNSEVDKKFKKKLISLSSSSSSTLMKREDDQEHEPLIVEEEQRGRRSNLNSPRKRPGRNVHDSSK
ncbi:Minor histocompatibility antigen H13 [Coelomomyces lativittatus]|nr:Minor histocompatibility antigen H13 [Coelomomyces lativittatus]